MFLRFEIHRFNQIFLVWFLDQTFITRNIKWYWVVRLMIYGIHQQYAAPVSWIWSSESPKNCTPWLKKTHHVNSESHPRSMVLPNIWFKNHQVRMYSNRWISDRREEMWPEIYTPRFQTAENFTNRWYNCSIHEKHDRDQTSNIWRRNQISNHASRANWKPLNGVEWSHEFNTQVDISPQESNLQQRHTSRHTLNSVTMHVDFVPLQIV